jgi:hypothetical protein
MSSPIQNFADVIARWSSVADFAGDIGVDRKHAHGMRVRRSIPPYYWPGVVQSALKRGYPEITYELLVTLGGMQPLKFARAQPRLRLRRPSPPQRLAQRGRGRAR